MYGNTQHAKANRVEVSRKVGAGLVAGCLAVSMLPAVAFATPGQDGGPGAAQSEPRGVQMSQQQDVPRDSHQANGEGPARGDFAGFGGADASWQDAKSGERPDDQAQAPQGGREEQREALGGAPCDARQNMQQGGPQGEPRDMGNGQADRDTDGQPSARFADREFAKMPADILASNDSKTSSFAGGKTSVAGEAPVSGDGGVHAPGGDDTSGLDLFKTIIETIKSVLGL